RNFEGRKTLQTAEIAGRKSFTALPVGAGRFWRVMRTSRRAGIGLNWHRVVPSGLWEGNLWDRLPSRIQIALNHSAFSLPPQSGSPMPAEANGHGDARPATWQAPTGADLKWWSAGPVARSIDHVLSRPRSRFGLVFSHDMPS